jgi:hypothetical protein
LPVDELIERVLLEALAPDQIAIALAARGQLEEENQHLDRQWTLRRERARYEKNAIPTATDLGLSHRRRRMPAQGRGRQTGDDVDRFTMPRMRPWRLPCTLLTCGFAFTQPTFQVEGCASELSSQSLWSA